MLGFDFLVALQLLCDAGSGDAEGEQQQETDNHQP